MEVLPETTVALLTTALTAAITANALVIIGVIAFAVSIRFVMRWFTKSHKSVKA
jgi:hypothetical protein